MNRSGWRIFCSIRPHDTRGLLRKETNENLLSLSLSLSNCDILAGRESGGVPYICPKHPLTLIGNDVVGEKSLKGECAQIAQVLVPALANFHVSHWRRGAKVKGNRSLVPGTVIAVFDEHGRYLNKKGGVAHTALYVRQSEVGIEIVHQFQSVTCPKIKGGLIRFDGKRPAGYHSGVSRNGGTPEDDADNYYVVEL